MVQFYVNFNDEYTLGDNLFTVDAARWSSFYGTNTPTIVTDGARNVLSLEAGGDAAMQFIPAGSPTDFELLTLVRKVTTFPNTTVAGRLAGTGTANMSFLGGNLRNNTTDGRVYQYVSGGATDIIVAHGLNHLGWVWIRFRVDGDQRRLRMWQEGDEEPSTWLIDNSAGAGPSAAGPLGLLHRASPGQIANVVMFSVGINGAHAPTEPPPPGPTIVSLPNMTQGVEATITGANFGATAGTLEYSTTAIGPWTTHVVDTWDEWSIIITPNLPITGDYYWRVTTTGAEETVGGPNTVVFLIGPQISGTILNNQDTYVSKTYPFEVPAGSNALLVIIGTNDTSTADAVVSYNGVSLEQEYSASHSSVGVWMQVHYFYLLNPAIGINDLIVTRSVTRRATVFAVPLANAGALGTFTGDQAEGDVYTISANVSSEAGDLVFLAGVWRNSSTDPLWTFSSDSINPLTSLEGDIPRRSFITYVEASNTLTQTGGTRSGDPGGWIYAGVTIAPVGPTITNVTDGVDSIFTVGQLDVLILGSGFGTQ